MSKIDLISNDWVDLVFEGRNQAYGAYKLRKKTTKRNITAIISVVVLICACFIGLTVKNIVDEQRAKVAATQVNELTALKQPKKEVEIKQKKVQIQEPEKVVERVKSSIKFTAPTIKKDDEVKPEEELKTQDELMDSKTAIGTFDVKGNDDANGEVIKAKETIAQPEPQVQKVEENKVFEVVEQMPAFPGGDGELMKYLKDNMKYPPIAAENGVQGRVVVGFVVERDGSITDVRIEKSIDPSLDREAERVVKGMPRWIPGKQNGSPVRVKYRVPVTFRLQ
ncbi:MAG: energy transducer TonB [Prevotella sp.]|mgnify:CR=1 FL=1